MHTRQIVTTILDELNIPWWDEGTNVSIGSINIQCPFQDEIILIIWAFLMIACYFLVGSVRGRDTSLSCCRLLQEIVVQNVRA